MTVRDLTTSTCRPGVFGLILSVALSLSPIATATEAVTVPAGTEGDFLVVVWNRDVRNVFVIDRSRLQSKRLSQKGLLPDGTRPWSVSRILPGKQGRLQNIPSANAAEYHALADAMHVAAIQFPEPSATVDFDRNTRLSPQQRRAIFADAARNGYYVAAAHVAFPGIGKLRAEGDGFAWVPVSYIFGR